MRPKKAGLSGHIRPKLKAVLSEDVHDAYRSAWLPDVVLGKTDSSLGSHVTLCKISTLLPIVINHSEVLISRLQAISERISARWRNLKGGVVRNVDFRWGEINAAY